MLLQFRFINRNSIVLGLLPLLVLIGQILESRQVPSGNSPPPRLQTPKRNGNDNKNNTNTCLPLQGGSSARKTNELKTPLDEEEPFCNRSPGKCYLNLRSGNAADKAGESQEDMIMKFRLWRFKKLTGIFFR